MIPIFAAFIRVYTEAISLIKPKTYVMYKSHHLSGGQRSQITFAEQFTAIQ